MNRYESLMPTPSKPSKKPKPKAGSVAKAKGSKSTTSGLGKIAIGVDAIDLARGERVGKSGAKVDEAIRTFSETTKDRPIQYKAKIKKNRSTKKKRKASAKGIMKTSGGINY